MDIDTQSVLRPDELALYHRNPRRGDVSALETSLRANDQYRPVVVNRGTYTGRPNEVLTGNHTVMAIRNLALRFPDDERWWNVFVHYVDVDEDRASRIVLVDNKTGQMGGFDDLALADLLESVAAEGDLTGTAYTEDDLAALLDSVSESEEAEAEWESNSANSIRIYVRHVVEIAHRIEHDSPANNNIHGHRLELIWTFDLDRTPDSTTVFNAIRDRLTEWVDRAVDHGFLCAASDPAADAVAALGAKVLRLDAPPSFANLAHLFGSVATELVSEAELVSAEVIGGGYPSGEWRP